MTALQAHASLLDSTYWNRTLRKYSSSPLNGAAENEGESIYEAGLVALDISDNNYSDAGIAFLSRVIRKNQWILGTLRQIGGTYTLPASNVYRFKYSR